MKSLVFILLFLSAGIQAQVKKQEHGKRHSIHKKKNLKKQKNAKIESDGLKNFRDEEERRIINLSQQNDNAYKKDIVRKSSGGSESFGYEETRSSRTRLYLFVSIEG